MAKQRVQTRGARGVDRERVLRLAEEADGVAGLARARTFLLGYFFFTLGACVGARRRGDRPEEPKGNGVGRPWALPRRRHCRPVARYLALASQGVKPQNRIFIGLPDTTSAELLLDPRAVAQRSMAYIVMAYVFMADIVMA